MNRAVRGRSILGYGYVVMALFTPLLGPFPAAAQEGSADRGETTGTLEGASDLRPIALDDAVRDALEGNRVLEGAAARVDAAQARTRQASAFLWPTVDVEAGAVATDDPVGVFGTKLRQERFTQSDFELDVLNRPDAVTDWTGAATVRWAGLDPGSWSARDAARLAATAEELGYDRTRELVVFRTKALFHEAVATESRAAAMQSAVEAARSTAELIRSREGRGILTRADVLQAEAELAGAEARLVDARRARDTARENLRVHLGWPQDRTPVPEPDSSAPGPIGSAASPPDGEAARAALGRPDLSTRADLRSLELAAQAASARAREAESARLPSIEAFGALSSHAADIGGTRTASWTAGVRVQWPLFTGFARDGAIEEARAGARSVRADHGQRVREAEAEARNARTALNAAREGLAAAEVAARAAEEARRLVRRRFEEGFTTTSEMLGSDARAADAAARVAGARSAVGVAEAHLEFVLGIRAGAQ